MVLLLKKYRILYFYYFLAEDACDPTNGGDCKCRGCHSSCERCIGGTDTSCSECSDKTKLLYNGHC